MEYNKLIQLLQYNDEYEEKVFMPNEVFEDLQNNISKSPHVAFAYSYIYLITWLFRYAKYMLGQSNQVLFTQEVLKEILGYASTEKRLNYLIKNNGLLEQMNYLETTKNYPVMAQYVTRNSDAAIHYDWEELDEVIFTYVEDFAEEVRQITFNTPKNFKVKRPVRAFTRTFDEEEEILDGTFYYVDRTHLIPFDVFLFCMSKEDLGCVGFYLYSYLKCKNQLFTDGYDCPLLKLAQETGLSKRTLDKYLDNLKKYRMITAYHNQEFFAVGMRQEDRKANTYVTNEAFAFSEQPVVYEKIKTMPRKKYLEMLKEKQEADESYKCDIPLDQLPF
ncbi:hypothetical protein ACQKJC_11675 [Priestia koreensis]|uniref:hypothetical protein n=1 Tax=Priestia koreensis TaxID=284581 RepID=UPI003D0507D2